MDRVIITLHEFAWTPLCPRTLGIRALSSPVRFEDRALETIGAEALSLKLHEFVDVGAQALLPLVLERLVMAES